MAMNPSNPTLGVASIATDVASAPGLASTMETLDRRNGSTARSDATRWYAAYTCANHEKRVAEQLGAREVEYFLPLHESVRKWKDRRVRLQLPLFPGYIFVHMALCDRLKVQQVPGLARLVGFDGTPAELPEQEIETLRMSLVNGVRAEPHRYLVAGRRVRVMNGPMAGLRGILTRKKSNARLVVSLELIQRAIAVEIDEADIEPVV
jgi:transcription antitermination factor NusG